ncbi:MAG: cation diffusion facilitator family transporter [Candidatus Acidiferrales bacterium]
MKGVLRWAMAVTVALVATEFVAGWLGGSIALISDGVHNLTDLPTMLLAWLALLWVERPPSEEKTYGYHRAGILAAFTNGVLLTLVALYILWESYERLRAPVPVREDLMLWVAGLALVINGGITLALVRGRGDLNLRSILIHNLGDALSNVAILAGALAIRFWAVTWVDPVLGLAIGGMVLWSSWGILSESSHILLEGTPRKVRVADVAQAILAVPHVAEVHDVHVWCLSSDLTALSCHVSIPDMHMEESERILAAINTILAERFQITHSTIQFERAGLPRASTLYMPEPMRSAKQG